MKKFLFYFLTFAVALLIFSTMSSNSFAADAKYLKINSYGYITSFKKDETGDLVIPSTLNGLKITGIDNNAFNNCNSLTSISIPNSVTFLASEVFNGCNNLAYATYIGTKNECNNFLKKNILEIKI